MCAWGARVWVGRAEPKHRGGLSCWSVEHVWYSSKTPKFWVWSSLSCERALSSSTLSFSGESFTQLVLMDLSSSFTHERFGAHGAGGLAVAVWSRWWNEFANRSADTIRVVSGEGKIFGIFVISRRTYVVRLGVGRRGGDSAVPHQFTSSYRVLTCYSIHLKINRN